MSINVVVSSTAAGVSVSGGTSVAITVGSVGATVPVTVGGGIGPAGFLINPGTATNAFGTFQLTAGDGITITTSAAQFQIASYGTSAVSSLAPVQSVAGRIGNIALQASDVTAGTFAMARIPTISYTALADVPTSFVPVAHTHSTSDVVSFSVAAAAAAPVQSVAGRTGVITVAQLGASGTASSTTFLRGDGVWSKAGIGVDDALDGGFFYGVSTPTIFITQHPANQTASSGAASFSVSAYVTHDGTPSYQWQKKDPSGMAWTQRALPSAEWTSVAYGNGVFVAVSNGEGTGNGNIAATSTDGTTWTQRTLPSNQEWESVAYGGGTFVAVTAGAVAATSSDGITWTQRTLPTGVRYSSVTYGNGTFVAVSSGAFSSGANVAATSADGSSWTQQTLPASARWSSVTYGNGKFVAVSSSSSDIAATSPDGVTWTQRTLPNSRDWQSVAYGNGVFVAINSSGSFAATSADGINWTEAAMPFAGWSHVSFGDDAFFAVARTGAGAANTVAKSTDGIVWVQRSLPASARWCGVAYGGGVFVAIAGNGAGTSTIAASSVGSSVFTNIANATASVLSLSGLSKAADDGDQYRVVVSSAIAASVTSNAATLTVP